MKNISVVVSLLFVLISNAYAEGEAPVRQAKLTTVIEKVVAVTNDQGLPAWIRTPVCTKQSLINVYKSDGNMWHSLQPEDLTSAQCDSELFGKPVSVTVGAALGFYDVTTATGSTTMKTAILFLSWGNLDLEVPKIVHSPTADAWLNLQDILGPVSSGKIVDGVPQPPEPSEYFTAVINIEDGIR